MHYTKFRAFVTFYFIPDRGICQVHFKKSEFLQKEGGAPAGTPHGRRPHRFLQRDHKEYIHQDQVKTNRFADTCQALLTEAFLPRKAIPIFMILEVPYTFICVSYF